MFKRKFALLSTALCALMLLATACSQSKASNTSSPTSTAAPTQAAADSPTATYKAYSDAAKAQDVQAKKETISKKGLEFLERSAKIVGKSLDEYLTTKSEPLLYDAETRNEKVSGETATLEYKMADGWHTMAFVKEDGKWKIAYDQVAMIEAGETPAKTP